MKFNFNFSDVHKQQLLYGVAVLISIISVFSIIFMLSYYSEDPNQAALPSPGTSAFTAQADTQNPQGQVQGAQTQLQQPPSDIGPGVPSPKPSPSPSPTPSPSPLTVPSPTPTPSPSPTPTPAASSNPPPSAPSGLSTTSGCEGSNAKVVLTWSPVSNASSYKVFRNDVEIKDNVESTNYSDASVTVGTLYAYSLKAKNSSGESGHSESKTITPTACPSSPSPSSSPS